MFDLLRYQASAVSSVNVVTAEDWEFDGPGGSNIRSIGDIATIPFTEQAQLDAFKRISEPNTLARWDQPDWEWTLETVKRLGALTLSAEPLDIGFKLGSSGYQRLSFDGRQLPLEMLAWMADDGVKSVREVAAPNVWLEFWELRTALEIVADRKAGGTKWRAVIAESSGTFEGVEKFLELILQESGMSRDEAESLDYPLQSWFLLKFWGSSPKAGLVLGRGALSAYLDPLTPAQSMWLTLAITAGVLPSAFSRRGAGIAQCDYAPCGKLYYRKPSTVKGTFRFCSTECGKRFHAAGATRRRRATERKLRTSNGRT